MQESEERIRALEVELSTLKKEISDNINLDQESKRILTKLLSLTSFLMKAFEYGKVIGTVVLSLIGGWMLLKEFLSGVIR